MGYRKSSDKRAQYGARQAHPLRELSGRKVREARSHGACLATNHGDQPSVFSPHGNLPPPLPRLRGAAAGGLLSFAGGEIEAGEGARDSPGAWLTR